MALCNSLNLRIIQKLDRSAQNIIFTGRHVVLYVYDNESWEKSGVEGTLFIYRQKDDNCCILILNRQRTDNFLLPLNSIQSFEVEDSFLMLSGQNGVVYGLWFFCPTELENVGRALTSLCQSKNDYKEVENESKIIQLLNAAKRSKGTEAPVERCPSAFVRRLFLALRDKNIDPRIDLGRFQEAAAEMIITKEDIARLLLSEYRRFRIDNGDTGVWKNQ